MTITSKSRPSVRFEHGEPPLFGNTNLFLRRCVIALSSSTQALMPNTTVSLIFSLRKRCRHEILRTSSPTYRDMDTMRRDRSQVAADLSRMYYIYCTGNFVRNVVATTAGMLSQAFRFPFFQYLCLWVVTIQKPGGIWHLTSMNTFALQCSAPDTLHYCLQSYICDKRSSCRTYYCSTVPHRERVDDNAPIYNALAQIAPPTASWAWCGQNTRPLIGFWQQLGLL